MRLRSFVVCLALVVVTAPRMSAQGRDAVRVFLDCEDGCDFDYLRVETPWAAFVRDRAVADVHLLVTRLRTGGGGWQYHLHALGLAVFPGRADTLVFAFEPSVTDDAKRMEVLRYVQLSLVPYATRTARGSSLRVVAAKRDDDDEGPQSGPDRWNAWVFNIGADAEVEREQQQSDFSSSVELSAKRITEKLKTGVQFEGDFDRSRFTLDEDEGGEVTSTRERYNGGAVAVWSLGAHWGAGIEIGVSSSTFENTRLAVRAAPAIEYSVWPYEESTRRQLSIQYSIGGSAFRYREETIFDRLSETRPTHALVVGYDVRQPWGSANAGLEASSYLDDPSQHRLVFDGELNLRITRGLELEIGGSASLIRDQLSLVKRGATAEEILLRRRALQTDYRYDMRVGFSYTFGSIFNSVVNPRFGTGPGEILR